MQGEDEAEKYRSEFESMVWFDLLPFESVTTVDENTLKQVAIWSVLNQLGDSVTRSDYGEPMVSAADVDRYGAEVFGPDFRFREHASFVDTAYDLRYTYDPDTQMYTAPSTGLTPNYLPSVVEITRESGGVKRVVMGYVSTCTSDDQIVMTPDFDHPAKYMDYMLRRDGGDYYLYAVQPNTTHVPEPAVVEPALPVTPDDSDSSLPVVTSRPDSALLPDSSAEADSSTDTDGSDASGSDDGDGSGSAEDDSADSGSVAEP